MLAMSVFDSIPVTKLEGKNRGESSGESLRRASLVPLSCICICIFLSRNEDDMSESNEAIAYSS